MLATRRDEGRHGKRAAREGEQDETRGHEEEEEGEGERRARGIPALLPLPEGLAAWLESTLYGSCGAIPSPVTHPSMPTPAAEPWPTRELRPVSLGSRLRQLPFREPPAPPLLPRVHSLPES